MLPTRLTRRSLLRGAAASAACATALPRLAQAAALEPAITAETHTLLDGRITPFPLSSVRLLPGDFRSAAEINDRYLDSLATDRLLHTFRLTSGLTSTAQPLGGWELPDCELRGHFAGGHYLSAAAFSYATSGNEILRDRGNTMVAGLAACQRKNGNGYLSAYPTTLFEKLAAGKQVWAPFYTLHEILAGLIDMYVYTGNEDALQVAEGISGWTQAYFEGIGDEQRQRMLRTEYGGMNEALVNLYALTGHERHLATARLFEQPSFLDPLAARRDELQGLHANTHVPKIIGAARMYEVTGESRYRDIAEYFLGEVLAARTYAIGNTSEGEHWRTPPGRLANTLTLYNAECCVAYNLMKLERHVFSWSGDPRWMDAYERTLFNARLGTQNPQGLKQYFFPLAAGYWRAYNSPDESFWCCTGTGAEDFAKFTDAIYSHAGDSLYVHHFLASTLDWKEQGFALRQETTFPAAPETTLRITADSGNTPRTIFLRIPSWIGPNASVSLNDQPLDAFAQPGSYLALRRRWRAGDRIRLTLPMQLSDEPLAGAPQTRAAFYGPLVLAADLGPGPDNGPLRIIHGRSTAPNEKQAGPPQPNPKVHAAKRAVFAPANAPWIEPVSGGDLRFRAIADGKSIHVQPMYRVSSQKYSVYWDTETT